MNAGCRIRSGFRFPAPFAGPDAGAVFYAGHLFLGRPWPERTIDDFGLMVFCRITTKPAFVFGVTLGLASRLDDSVINPVISGFGKNTGLRFAADCAGPGFLSVMTAVTVFCQLPVFPTVIGLRQDVINISETAVIADILLIAFFQAGGRNCGVMKFVLAQIGKAFLLNSAAPAAASCFHPVRNAGR